MAATGYLDACGFNPASSGTGDFVVSAAITGYRTPASAGAVNSAVYSYRAQSADLSQWEVGFGAYTAGTTTLARTTVSASSTGSKVSFTSPPNIYVTALTADLQNASLLSNGTVPTARIGSGTASSSTFLRGDQSWSGIDGSNITTGTVPTARLGSGTASATTFLAGDQSYKTIQQSKVLLATYTASSSANISDTSFSSTYDDYEVVLEGINPASATQNLLVRLMSGGSYQASSYIGTYYGYDPGVPGAIAGTFPVTTAIVPALGTNMGTGSAIGSVMRILAVNDTTKKKQVVGQSSWINNLGSGIIGTNWGGVWNGGNGTLTGVQILFASGNISSGTVKVYGLL